MSYCAFERGKYITVSIVFAIQRFWGRAFLLWVSFFKHGNAVVKWYPLLSDFGQMNEPIELISFILKKSADTAG